MCPNLRDKLGRQINYLRVSVTDRCNMRCVYCMPSEGVHWMPHSDILRYEEILQVVSVAKQLGISHVRLTGGEPLVRQGIVDLVKSLKYLGIEDISMTTNGELLREYAAALKKAGLSRVNISLDSLRPDRFLEVTRVGDLSLVMKGIHTAISQNLHPVKINVVAVKHLNHDEIGEIAALTLREPLHVRFIELMPVGPDDVESQKGFLPLSFIKQEVEKLGPLVSVKSLPGVGPASTFSLPMAKGTVGFIAALSQPFCLSCNRLRLTADGKLRPCLASDCEVDLKHILRAQSDIDRPGLLKKAFQEALEHKPSGHGFWTHRQNSRRMCQIGG